MILPPQISILIGAALTFAAGVLASRGIISGETAAYLGSPETLTTVMGVVTTLLGILAWWKTRPKAVVASAANIVGKDGGVIIASPQMANSDATPANVVASVREAANLVQARSGVVRIDGNDKPA